MIKVYPFVDSQKLMLLLHLQASVDDVLSPRAHQSQQSGRSSALLPLLADDISPFTLKLRNVWRLWPARGAAVCYGKGGLSRHRIGGSGHFYKYPDALRFAPLQRRGHPARRDPTCDWFEIVLSV